MTQKEKRIVPSSNIYGAYIIEEVEPGKFVKKEVKKDKRNLCNYCPKEIRGLCCYYSVTIKGVEVVCDQHCQFLDILTGHCKVYKNRFQENPDCFRLEDMKKLGTLPRKCPYVQFDKMYQARIDLRLYFDEFDIIRRK